MDNPVQTSEKRYFQLTIDAACKEGLIDNQMKNDLHIIRKVRNESGHELIEEGLESPKIIDMMSGLSLLKDLFPDENRENLMDEAIFTTSMVANSIINPSYYAKIELTQNQRPKR